jgi:hypothetical protein
MTVTRLASHLNFGSTMVVFLMTGLQWVNVSKPNFPWYAPMPDLTDANAHTQANTNQASTHTRAHTSKYTGSHKLPGGGDCGGSGHLPSPLSNR